MSVLLLKLFAMPPQPLQQLRRFNGNCRLRRQCFQNLFVGLVEKPGLFVQYLKRADDLSLVRSQRDGEEAPRAVTATKINLVVKARVLMSILDINCLSANCHGSRNT